MRMIPEHDGHDGNHGQDGHRKPEPEQEPVWVQGVNCGRCGWPNARQVQRGMRRVQFFCQWCEQFTTAVVDPTLRGMIGF
jgi:hypothetical protein